LNIIDYQCVILMHFTELRVCVVMAMVCTGRVPKHIFKLDSINIFEM